MKRWTVPGVVLLLTLGLSALPAMAGGDATAGKAVFSKSCASCHGPNGEGKDAIAKMLKAEMKPLGSKEVQAKSDADLRKAITEGTGKMKPVKGLSDKDLDNVIAFVRTLAKK
jgi:mono/diheme cytochrome c family protein